MCFAEGNADELEVSIPALAQAPEGNLSKVATSNASRLRMDYLIRKDDELDRRKDHQLKSKRTASPEVFGVADSLGVSISTFLICDLRSIMAKTKPAMMGCISQTIVVFHDQASELRIGPQRFIATPLVAFTVLAQ